MIETKHSNDKAFFLDKGLRCLDAKDPLAAISAFENALRLDPSSGGAYSGIGQAFLDMEEFLGAKEAFSKSIERAPTPARYVLLGYALAQLGDQLNAFRAFKKALRMSPQDNDALFNMGNMLKDKHPRIAIALLTRAVKANSNSAESRLELGALLNRTGQFQEAKSVLEKAINLKSGDVWIWIELANALWRINEQDRGEAILKMAAEKFPTATAPLWTLASFFENSGRIEEAESLFQESVERNPVDEIAQKMLTDFRARNR